MRKGIALTLETIVVLVLAVLALAVLLYFFSSNFYPTEKKIDDLNMQRDLCLQYSQNVPECKTTQFPKYEDLRKLCVKLGYQGGCNIGGDGSLSCVRKCCSLFCPQQPEPGK